MNKIILLTLLSICGQFFSLSASLLDYEEPMALYVGDIVFNTDIDPDLCLYYKGNKLQLDINHDKRPKKIGVISPKKELVRVVPYSLHEAKASQQFHILICCRPEFASESNTITYLHVPYQTSYKFYTLTGSRQYDENNQVVGCLWNMTEQQLSDDRIIPDNTIIFLFNADLIEGLEVKSWPVNSNVRLLPSIVVKKTLDVQDVVRALVEARLAAIDFDAIHHRHIKNPSKIENKTVVTIKS